MVRRLLSGLLVLFTMLLIVQKTEAAETEETEKNTFSSQIANMAEVRNIRYNMGNGRIRLVLDVTKKIDHKEMFLENPSRMVIDIDNAWIGSDVPKEIELNSTAASKVRIAQFDKTIVRLVIETSAENNIFYLEGGDVGGRLVIDIGAGAEQPNFADKMNEGGGSVSVKVEKVDEVDEPFKSHKVETDPSTGIEIIRPDSSNTSDDNKSDKEKEKKEKKSKKDKKDKKSKKDQKSKKDEKEAKDDKDTKDDKDGKTYIDKKLDELTTLEDKVIVIDAGHGGNDAGAIGPSGVMEKTVTLKVALELEKLLLAEGAEVIMTRRTDVEVAARGRHATDIEELKSRCDIANEAEADIFISIHADSFTNPAARGTTCYYFGEGAPESKKLAESVHPALLEQLKTPSRGTKPCNFYVVRNTDMPAILVELAFISNPQEESLLNSKEGVEKAAQGILDGIEDYFG